MTLLLINDSNEYQRGVRADAEAAARRLDVTLDVQYAHNDVVQQIRQLYACARAGPESRPCLVAVFPVRDGSFELVLRDAAAAGVGCVMLNRRPKYLQDVRRMFPAIPFGTIGPDQVEIGRLQGRQASVFAGAEGLVLYVMGPSLSSATHERLAGFREVMKSSTSLRSSEIHGDWDAGIAEKAVRRWLQLVLICDQGLRVVVCQNDAMAIGAKKALEAAAVEMNRPELARLPVTGVDGLAEVGQKLVQQRVLAGTILQQSTGGPAIEWVGRWLSGAPLKPDVVLPVVSYPEIGRLSLTA
jgi:ABC-type sugar transport system substrate-binding protein